MLKITKPAKNRPLRVIYLFLLCSTQCWIIFLEKWCGDLDTDTIKCFKYPHLLVMRKGGNLRILKNLFFDHFVTLLLHYF